MKSIGISWFCLVLWTVTLTSGHAAAYLSDPAVSKGGNGSKGSPWPSLEACISAGHLQKLKPGDTLYLLNGFHGSASISGINEDFICIAGAPGHDVRLAKLEMTRVAKWHIKNIRLSPSFGSAPYKGNILSFGDRSSESGENIIENCEVFAVDDHTGLSVKEWMGLNSGILMGRHAKGSMVKNCYIRNTRFALALSAYDGVAEGNVIENFSADGIRMVRDGQTASHNIIKGAFASDAEGDKNHDDAIQCFLHNKGTGTMRNLTITHNIIMGHAPSTEPHAAVNQGIGLFDGPLVNFHIEGNVVMVSHYHGVSVFDGQGCTVTKNVVFTIFPGKLRPWVMLGTKLKQAKDNTVTDNYAMSFKLKQPGTIEGNNKIVNKDIYEQALRELSAQNFELFDGPYHRIAKRHRITGAYIEELPPLKSETEEASSAASEKTTVRQTNKSKEKVVKEGQAEIFNTMLQARLDSWLEQSKRKPRFVYSVFKQEISIAGKDGAAYKAHVPKLGSQMTINIFKRLKAQDALAIIRAIIDKDNEQDNALMAFYCYVNKDTSNGSFHLRKAGAFAEQVENAFEESE